MCSPKRESHVSLGTGASNGSCSDAMTLPIIDCLFYLDVGMYSAVLGFSHSQVIGVNGLSISVVFGETQKWHLFMITVNPATSAMASKLTISYEELKNKVEEVQHQLVAVLHRWNRQEYLFLHQVCLIQAFLGFLATGGVCCEK